MDIQTKDGILLRNIPDGTPDDVIKERIAKIRGTTTPETPAEPPTDWLRKIAIGGRAAFEGAMGLPMMAADAYQQGPLRRSLGDPTPAPAERLQGALDKVTYKARTGDERLLADTVSGATGALAGGGPVKAALGALTAGGMGGLSAGLTREAGGNEFWQMIAGLVGGMTPAAVKGVASGVADKVGDVGATIGAGFGNERAIKRLARDAAERTSGADRDFVRAAERGATTFVPGAKPTTAEAIAERNMRMPDVRAGATVKLQKDLTGAPGVEDILPSIAKRQQIAIETPIQRMAGGETRELQDAAQEAAKAFRSANAGAQYEKIAPTVVKPDMLLKTLLDSNSGTEAMRLARKIADDDQAARLVAGKSSIPFEIKDAKGNVTGYTAQGLQYVKSALDDMASNKSLQEKLGIAGTGQAKVTDVRNELVSWMNKAIPGWEKARVAYSEQSEPLNRLQVAQALADKLKNEKGTLTSGTFLNVRGRGEEGLIKKATGGAREITFDAPDEATLAGVTKQLSRQEAVNRIANEVKSSSAGNLAASDIPTLPNLLSRPAMVANFALKVLGKGANEPVAREISKRFADGTYGELLSRPVNDPARKVIEAMIRASTATAAQQGQQP